MAYIPCEEYLDLETLVWGTLPPTRHMHLHPQAAVPLNDRIYLLGNRGNGEIYHPMGHTWTPMARFQRESYEVTLQAVACQGAIYACFSENQDVSGSLASYLTERPNFAKYDPIVDDWTVLTPHVLDRSIGLLTDHHKLFADEDHLYVSHYTHRNRCGVVHYKVDGGLLTEPTLELHSLKETDEKDSTARRHHQCILIQWQHGLCLFETDRTIPDCSRTYINRGKSMRTTTSLQRGTPPPIVFNGGRHSPVITHIKISRTLVKTLLKLPNAKYKLSSN